MLPIHWHTILKLTWSKNPGLKLGFAMTILPTFYSQLRYDTSIMENTMTNSATVSPTPSTMR